MYKALLFVFIYVLSMIVAQYSYSELI